MQRKCFLLSCLANRSLTGHDPDKRKLDAILSMPCPENKAALQRLLRMTTYLARCCRSYSEVTAPVRQMLAQDSEFRWDERHTAALEKIKRLLTTAHVLGYYSPQEEVTQQCDSSSYALSAVLLQNGRVIEYASRAMTEAERNYAQIEKELLSIVFGFERYHTYLYARPDKVKVQTDHKPLLAITKKALGAAPKRLQRMLLRLQRYNLELHWVPGRDLILADALSRAVAADTATVSSGDADDIAALSTDAEQMGDLRMVASQRTVNALRAAAADDPVYQRLKRQIIAGWPDSQDDVTSDLKPYFTFADELAVSGDLVFKGQRVILPLGYRQAIYLSAYTARTLA